MCPHRVDEARHLLDGLAFGSQRDQEAGELPRRDVTGHDLVHDVARLVTVEGLSLEELLNRLGGRHGRGYW